MQEAGPWHIGGGVAVCWRRACWVRRSLRCPAPDDNRKPRDDSSEKARRRREVSRQRETERSGRDGLDRSVKRELRPRVEPASNWFERLIVNTSLSLRSLKIGTYWSLFDREPDKCSRERRSVPSSLIFYLAVICQWRGVSLTKLKKQIDASAFNRSAGLTLTKFADKGRDDMTIWLIDDMIRYRVIWQLNFWEISIVDYVDVKCTDWFLSADSVISQFNMHIFCTRIRIIISSPFLNSDKLGKKLIIEDRSEGEIF